MERQSRQSGHASERVALLLDRLAMAASALWRRRRAAEEMGPLARRDPPRRNAVTREQVSRAFEEGRSLPYRVMAEQLNISESRFQQIARELGLRKGSNGRVYGRKVADEKVMEEWARGGSTREIASRLGMSLSGTRLRLKELGLRPHMVGVKVDKISDEDILEAYTEGITKAELCRKLGVSPNSITRRLDELGLAFKRHPGIQKVTDDQIRQANMEGLTLAEAASRLGVDAATVARRYRQLGLKSQGRRGRRARTPGQERQPAEA